MTGRIGVAIFGLGRAGYIHYQNILANYRVTLCYIVDKDIEKAQAVVDKYGVTKSVCVISPEDAKRVYEDPA